MLNSRTGAHPLHLAGHDFSVIAERIFVRHSTFEHVGNDLHVSVTVHSKALTRRDVVVVNHAQRAEMYVLVVLIFSKREAESALQPAMIGLTAIFGFSKRQHETSFEY